MYSAPPSSISRPPTSFVLSRTRSITIESGMLYARSLFGIEPHLILAHEAAERSHLRHSGNGLQLIAKEPVLETPQIRQAVAMVVVHDGVFVNPSRAGGIRADAWDERPRAAVLRSAACTRARANAPSKDPSRLRTRRTRMNRRTWSAPVRLSRAARPAAKSQSGT